MIPELEREILILENVTKKSGVSQRELAKCTGLSLGLINVLIKKVIGHGWIEVSHLNKKKVKYHVTPAGFHLLAQNNYRETLNAIRTYRAIHTNLKDLLRELQRQGYEHFSIHGDGELRDLVETTFKECLENTPARLSEEHSDDLRAVVLKVTVDPPPEQVRGNVVNVLEKIAERTMQ